MSDWLQATVKVSGKNVETALNAFEFLNALAVTQQNAGEDDYYDLAHPAEPGWWKQLIVGLFHDEVDQNKVVSYLDEKLPAQTPIELTQLADQDWESAWIDQYQPTQINDRVWVYPSWSDPAPTHEVVVRIDPGLAFGTGTHPTTGLCLDALSHLDLTHTSVMDYGCGSGILAIAALLMGAESAVGVDIDSKAEAVSRENAELNGVADRFAIQSTCETVEQILSDGLMYDVVIANILAGALIDMSETISTMVRPGGKLLLSGVLEHQADNVINAYQDQFDLKISQQAEWVLLSAVKSVGVL